MNCEENTLIEQGGVFRCCLGTVAEEYISREVEIGDTSECTHCHTKFELVTPERAVELGTSYHKPTKAIWKPVWQLEKKL